MYDNVIIRERGYTSLHRIEAKVKWRSLQDKYNIRIKFKRVMHSLEIKGWVYDHGKSGQTYSLTQEAATYFYKQSL
jgi:hypothetical protein